MLDLHIKVNFRVGKRSIITMKITPEKKMEINPDFSH